MFDSLAIAAIADELRDRVGGRVQRVVQSDGLSIGVELYVPGERIWLVATADPRRSGIWLVGDKVGQSPDPPSPLLLLLRKHLPGRCLISVDQPPFERVLRLTFARVSALEEDESPDEPDPHAPASARALASLSLIVEATGRLGNVILVDADDLILEAIKRVPPSINRHRSILPRRPYVGPPPQAKATPLEATPAFLSAQLDSTTARPGASALVAILRGLSPLAAREAVFRAAGRAEASVGDIEMTRLAAAIGELVAPLAGSGGATWRPSIGLAGEQVIAFAPYELRHLDGWQATATMSEAVARAAGAGGAPTPVEQARAQLLAEIAERRQREQRRLEALARELDTAASVDRLREDAELLLAYATQIAPGSASFALEDRTLTLDPTLTPLENAQRLFERYSRQRDARRRLPEMIEAARERLRYLDEMVVHADLAPTTDVVSLLRTELRQDAGAATAPARAAPAERAKVGALPGQPGKARPAPSGRSSVSARSGRPSGPAPSSRASVSARSGRPSGPARARLGDHAVRIGRTARENDVVTFDLAQPNDLWLHARGVPGSHVILHLDAGTPPEALIRRAAAVAAYHSSARHATSVPVDVTERRHVRKIKGGGPGAVTYTGERTLYVTPQPLGDPT